MIPRQEPFHEDLIGKYINIHFNKCVVTFS